MIKLLGIFAGMYAIFILAGITATILSRDDKNENKFGPRPTGPEPGKGVLITQNMLPEDEQYKSHDE